MYRIPHSETFPLDPLRLAAERGRLVRLCGRHVGNGEIAEDLAQETLAIAWQRRHTLRNGDVWQAWLNGIARNVCLRYLRRNGIERERLVSANGEGESVSFETLPDLSLPDFDELLEQEDIFRLLDRALHQLPDTTQDLLIDRYVNEMPIEEIAARRGLREETATVQLHRSRQALKRVLSSPELRAETAALGLIEENPPLWQETRLWCPDCGMQRLEGLMGYIDSEKSSAPAECKHCGKPVPCFCKQCDRRPRLSFGLRCPRCMRAAESFDKSLTLVYMGDATMLEGIKGFKPALNRINRWWHEYTRELITRSNSSCMRCGHHDIEVRTVAGPPFPWESYHGRTGLFTRCPRCNAAAAIETHEIARQLPEGQKFWQKHPRVRTHMPRRVDSIDGGLLVTRLESINGSSAIEIALHEQTMEVARIITTGNNFGSVARNTPAAA